MIVCSPYPDVTIPEVPLTPFVLRHAERLGNKPALIDGPSGRTLTYAQLARSIKLAAAGLAKRNFQKGDVFAIFSPNLPEYAIAFHATALLGGIFTTINPTYTATELAHQLNDSGAQYLLTVPQIMEKAVEAARKSKVKEIFVFGEAEGATPFAALLQGEEQVPEIRINPREDLVVLPYSSGTTGPPKGVMLTHRNLVANIRQMEAGFGSFLEKDILMGVLPFLHIFGMVVTMNMALHCGSTIVTMPRFDLAQFLEIAQRYGVTFSSLVPPIILALAKDPIVDNYKLSNLRTICSGAAPLSDAIAQACAERLDCVVLQGYGLTEASPATHSNPRDPDKIKMSSIGPCLPNTECKVVDVATSAELGPNEQGEIWVRGPQVMKGYLNRPEATLQTVDADGWLHTGDIGYADSDGYFYLVDRVKDLIKYKGLQVAPAELEAVLLSHPAIADVAVIPIPDEEAGEVPKAFVVLKGEATAQAIMAHVAERVAPYKKIRSVEFVEQIPKSPAGKILRRVLVERERGIRK